MNDTWIDPEEFAYTPKGSQIRKGRAMFPDNKVRAFRAGIPDTWFSIPAHARISGRYIRGYITSGEDRRLEFRVMDSYKETFNAAIGKGSR